MAPYGNDRAWTNSIHDRLAVSEYMRHGFRSVRPANSSDDMLHGIDYWADNGTFEVPVQERFRRTDQASFRDITFRYTRSNSASERQKLSEWFKLDAAYMLNGAVNSNESGFLWLAFLDLSLFDHLVLVPKSQREIGSRSFIQNDAIVVPIMSNRDGSSEFIAISIDDIAKLSSGYIDFWV